MDPPWSRFLPLITLFPGPSGTASTSIIMLQAYYNTPRRPHTLVGWRAPRAPGSYYSIKRASVLVLLLLVAQVAATPRRRRVRIPVPGYAGSGTSGRGGCVAFKASAQARLSVRHPTRRPARRRGHRAPRGPCSHSHPLVGIATRTKVYCGALAGSHCQWRWQGQARLLMRRN